MEYVLHTTCSEQLAKERAKALPQAEVINNYNDEQGFERRWQMYVCVCV